MRGQRLLGVFAAGLMATSLTSAAIVGTASTVGASAHHSVHRAAATPLAYTVLLTGDPECQLATVDLTTGATTALPAPASNATCISDLAETSDGRVYGIRTGGHGDTVDLIQFDTTTGAPTNLGAIGSYPADIGPPNGFGFGGLTFDAAGRLFVSMVSDDPGCLNGQGSGDAFCLFQVDLANLASATFKGLGDIETEEAVLAASCDGLMVTLSEPVDGVSTTEFGHRGAAATDDTTTTTAGDGAGAQDDPSAQAFAGLLPDPLLNRRDPADGSMTPIGSGAGAGILVRGLAFDTSGKLWGIGLLTGLAVSTNVLTVDPVTGVATAGPALNGDAGGQPFGLALPLQCPVQLQPSFTG